MEKAYKARYYNGQYSQAFTVDLSFEGDNLHIVYHNERGVYTETRWDREHIKETEFSNSLITLRYGTLFPYQQLEITDPEFIRRYKTQFKVSWYKRYLLGRTGTSLSILFIALIGSVWLGYLFVLPFMADQAAKVFPKEYEISMGKRLYESVLQGEAIDTAKTEAINHFFSQIKTGGDYPVQITVVKSDVVNAFALPGGGIVVYSGILNNMQSPDQLAALLSHEYSHVQLKHSTRNIFRNLAGYLFVSVLFGDLNGISAIVIQNAETLRTLSYSRDLETEADNNGLKILEENRIDPQGMVKLFEQLKKEEKIELNEMLSTHPDLEHRIINAQTFKKDHPYTPLANDSLHYYFDKLK